jgi:hypothetical protein
MGDAELLVGSIWTSMIGWLMVLTMAFGRYYFDVLGVAGNDEAVNKAGVTASRVI